MTNGAVIINGTDVSTTLGVYVVRKGYKELLQWPSLRTVSGNNWQEEDGFEPDLSNPRIDNREFNMSFVCNGGTSSMLAFYDLLKSTPVLSCSFPDAGVSLDLRLVSMTSVDFAKVFNLVTVRFACGTPFDGHTGGGSGSSSGDDDDLYVLDGTPLSAYGVRVLKGTIKNVVRQPGVKPLLLRKNSAIDGAQYDENPLLYSDGSWERSSSQGDVTTASYDITLRCLLMADTRAGAIANYYSLLHALVDKNEGEPDPTLAGSRNLVVRPVGGIFRCYYKGNQVNDYFFGDAETWIEFNLTLCLFEQIGTCEIEDGINDTPSGGGGGTTTIRALATEDNVLVLTEDGKVIVLRT